MDDFLEECNEVVLHGLVLKGEIHLGHILSWPQTIQAIENPIMATTFAVAHIGFGMDKLALLVHYNATPDGPQQSPFRPYLVVTHLDYIYSYIYILSKNKSKWSV